jgi:hypothetical protein
MSGSPARRAAGVAAAALLLAGPATETRGQGGGRSAQLESVLSRLADRAAIYEKTALRFACEEEVTLAEYDGSETVKKQSIEVHDYLLEYTERNGLQPFRALLARNAEKQARKEVRPDYAVPEPYGWNLLFTRERQTRFQFELVDTAVLAPAVTWVIAFKPLLSYTDGNTVEQWEGRAWVDQDSFDILQIEAQPANQEATMQARLAEYRQSFRFLGLHGKSRPRMRQIQVEFGIAKEGLRFPSRSLASTRLVAGDASTRLDSSVVQRYRDYVFYDVESLEQMEKLRTGGP